jgi:hypothetical protein
MRLQDRQRLLAEGARLRLGRAKGGGQEAGEHAVDGSRHDRFLRDDRAEVSRECPF